MAFDKPTRARLARFVSEAREVLTSEFTEKFQSLYGLSPSGEITPLEDLPNLDDTQRATAQLLRERLAHLVAGNPSERNAPASAVARLSREQAFTILNRLAAIRMAEKRGLIVECVGRAYESNGFRVYCQVAGSALGDTYHRYRRYLFCLFDELAVDLGVLFDRRSPFGLLFPRASCLLKLLGLLNAPDLETLWAEDETIGWIYQYWNDPAERKKMREESAAPRNSRELAVRNQFFTPRYVVEFLTDNTLGRIWYEMTQGQTKLKDQCRYLVRRPNEIFLKPGENPPATPTPSAAKDSPSPPSEGEEGRGEVGRPSTLNPQPATALTQEELLLQPVHIPHRPLKDPRTILMLDPACGSMHFGLYAFDLFEAIYDEAWDIAKSGPVPPGADKSFSDFCLLPSEFSSKEEFLRQVPRLIIEHNLHGIDIDPRCAQIAGLSLWLRAHKAWQRLGLRPTERPAIKRSNIVCAEPMPGEKELLREFVECEFQVEERGVFLGLLEAIFDKMQLAGEAGSLIKIEEEIRSAIEAARAAWQILQNRPEELFSTSELNAITIQPELDVTSNLRTLTSDFWETAESRLLTALRDYAEQAENGGGFQRRLFAEDAARGFAFIDVCRKRYDVAVMNPPFGEPSKGSKNYIIANYPRTKNDVYAAFVERWLSRLYQNGRLAAITSRTGFFLGSFHKWREEVLLKEANPMVLADLGMGVLDSAMVETAAYVIERASVNSSLLCFRHLQDEDKGASLYEEVEALRSAEATPRVFAVLPVDFKCVPGAPFAYWVKKSVRELFATLPAAESGSRRIALGLSTKNDTRFVRVWWEVESGSVGRDKKWANYANGGSFSPFHFSYPALVLAERDCAELRAYLVLKFPYLGGNAGWILHDENDYRSPVISWPLRTHAFSPAFLPRDFFFSARTYAAVIAPDRIPAYVGLFASEIVDFLLKVSLGRSGHPEFVTGVVRSLPVPQDIENEPRIAELALESWRIKRSLNAGELTSHEALLPSLLIVTGTSLSSRSTKWSEQVLSGANQLARIQSEINALALRLYRLTEEDLGKSVDQSPSLEIEPDGEEIEDDAPSIQGDANLLVLVLVDYLLGCAFGRWDIRYATGEKAAPELPDPFAPLPVCPPGQLQNAQGLPARPEDVPAAYPVRIPWDGILVDDPGHPMDVETRVREVIEIIWSGGRREEVQTSIPTDHRSLATGHCARPEEIEAEACGILGVRALRDYFRKPAGFFADHLKRYSKSRRQAPHRPDVTQSAGRFRGPQDQIC